MKYLAIFISRIIELSLIPCPMENIYNYQLKIQYSNFHQIGSIPNSEGSANNGCFCFCFHWILFLHQTLCCHFTIAAISTRHAKKGPLKINYIGMKIQFAVHIQCEYIPFKVAVLFTYNGHKYLFLTIFKHRYIDRSQNLDKLQNVAFLQLRISSFVV